MAKKEKMDYAAELRALSGGPPDRLYLLWGEEEYLLESYYSELRKLVFPEGDNGGMNLRRLNGQPDAQAVSDAVSTLPFFSDRTLVELRGFNPNNCPKSESARLAELLGDIPAHCTVAMLPGAGFEPDGRMSLIKAIKKTGRAIEFTSPSSSQLIMWIRRRFAAQEKKIDKIAAEHLIFMCSPLINRLKPEIEKLSAYVDGPEIRTEDIDKVVDRLPETRVFELTDCLAQRDYNGAAESLAALLEMKEQPAALLAMVGAQFRRLYAARLSIDNRLGEEYVRETANVRYDFMLRKLLSSARKFTLAELGAAIAGCAECDYRLKSSSQDGAALLGELILSLAIIV